MGVRTWLAAAAAAAMCMAAGSAGATVYTITFDGTFTSGTDVGGDFGAAGANLAGDAFALTATYDDSLGSQNAPGATSGGFEGLPTPTLSSGFTVNGVTLPIDGSSSSYYVRYLPIPGGAYAVVQLDSPVNAIRIAADGPVTALSGGLTWDGTGQFFDDTGGTISLVDGLYGRLTVDEVTVTPVADPNIFTQGTLAIPEPATWMLLLLGIGLMGLTLRRRSAVTFPSGDLCA
jgi:hypothetical protein